MSVSNPSTSKLVRGLILVLVASAAYLYPFPQSNLVYPAIVVIHALTGVIASVVIAAVLLRLLQQGSIVWKLGWLLVSAGAVLGLILTYTGTAHSESKWLYAHIILSMLGLACLLAEMMGSRGWVSSTGAYSGSTRCCTARPKNCR